MITSAVIQEGPTAGIFGELDESIRARLAAAGRFESGSEGSYVIVQGREHRNLVFVVSGNLRVTCVAHGDTVTLAELGAGEIVGEMSLIDPRPASASVKVIGGPAALWMIDGDAFDRIVEEDESAAYALTRVLARNLCRRLRHDAENMLHRENAFRTRFRDMDY